MTAYDRRMAILRLLCRRRHCTLQELVDEFDTPKRTICRDIEMLSCSYPIYTITGPAGGIFIEDGYYLGKQYLNEEQESLIRELAAATLDVKQQATLQSILDKFAHKGVKK